MSRNVRRAAGSILVLAACGIGTAGFLSNGGREHARAEVSASARLAAQSAQREIEQAWQTELRMAEQRVSDAIAQKALQAAVSERGASGLQAKLQTADWWRPIRDDFEVVRVISGAGVIARQEQVDMGIADSELVAAARMHRVASAVLSIQGRALLAAAARIPPLTAAVPVLVLANPIGTAVLQRLYDRTGQALMLAPGNVAGAPDQLVLIQRLAGREAEEVVVDPRGRWVAATVTLGPGVRLWTLKREALEGAGAANGPWIAGIAGIVLGVAGLLLLFIGRDGIAAAVSGVIKGETTLPFGAPRTRSQVQTAPTARPRLRTVPPLPPLDTPAAPSAAAPPAETPRPPNVFGRYTLLEHLGRGGMADVYVAAAYGAEGFCRTFVLKRIRRELAHDKDAVSHFIDEACMQASLVHSNIVPVFDFGVVDGEYFMTEEYVLGRDVSRVVERHLDQTAGPLDPALAYYIAHETLVALEFAHTKRDKEGKPLGIVHRDVSPGNVMVSVDGDVKLFDFGIVKSNARNTQTMMGLVKGNANFMSPEQARGEDVDRRSDLFSMGVVMYFCLTGNLLYEGTTDLEIIHKAAIGPTEKEWDKIRRLPGAAPDILRRALAPDRNKRFQSAADFARELSKHLTQKKPETAALMEVLFGEDLKREAA